MRRSGLINNQHQRGRTSSTRASHNTRGDRRIHRDQHAASGQAAKLVEGLLRDCGLKVLRIDERGWYGASIPENLRLRDKITAVHGEQDWIHYKNNSVRG